MNQETKENKVIFMILFLVACGCFAAILVTTFVPKSQQEQPAQQTGDGIKMGVDVIMEGEEDSAGNKTQITLNETLQTDNSVERR
jgi:hypothetical protein